MSWLLDVNALVALAQQGHADHQRLIRWFASLIGSGAKLETCSITEIGFVRVSIEAGFEADAAGPDRLRVTAASTGIRHMKKAIRSGDQMALGIFQYQEARLALPGS